MGLTSHSPLEDRMVFIVGAQRSGTYWLQRIVTAHSEVSAVPSETALFSHGIAPLFERFQHSAKHSPQVGAMYVEHETLIASTRRFCDDVLSPYLEPGARFLAERTAVQVRHLALIGEIYPDARFVHIIRDGRDVARSTVAQPWGPDTIEEGAQEWRSAIEDARAADIPGDRYREVRYEQLLEDPRSVIASLYEWLDLPSTQAELDQALSEARREQNVDRYGKPGVAKAKWRSEFDAADIDAFNSVAGDLLEELGYSDGSGGAPRAGRVRKVSLGQAARRAARAARGSRTDPASATPAERVTVADRGLSALRAGRVAEFAQLTTEDFLCRVYVGEETEVQRGKSAVALLHRLIRKEGALSGRDTLGHVHPGGSGFGYVLRISGEDGVRRHVVVFITVPGERISDLSIYLM